MEKTNLPLVSILVPVYNVEEYIERCAHSLFEQSYGNVEFIFADDGSTDDSIKILKQIINYYPAQQSFIRIIRHPKNKGLTATRNTLVSAAEGDFVYHVDPDDWLELNAVEKLVTKMLEANADIVIGRHYCHKKNRIVKFEYDGYGLNKEKMIQAMAERRCVEIIWNKLIRRRLYSDFSIIGDETIKREDTLPGFRLLFYAKRIEMISDRIYHHDDENPSSIMNKTRHDINLISQTFTYTKQVWNWFAINEPAYKDVFANYHYKALHQHLAKYGRDKSVYSFIIDYIQKTDKKYWKLIGWDNPFTRFIDSHFLLYKVKYSCLAQLNEIRKYIKWILQ